MNMKTNGSDNSDGASATTAPATAVVTLAALARQLQDAIEATEEIRRKLCTIGLREGYQPEEFHRRLLEAGLSYSLASELKTVLQAKAACEAFIRAPGETGRPSWVATLAAARAALCEEIYGMNSADQLAARVAGLFHKTSRRTLSCATGVLTLEIRPGELRHLLSSTFHSKATQ